MRESSLFWPSKQGLLIIFDQVIISWQLNLTGAVKRALKWIIIAARQKTNNVGPSLNRK